MYLNMILCKDTHILSCCGGFFYVSGIWQCFSFTRTLSTNIWWTNLLPLHMLNTWTISFSLFFCKVWNNNFIDSIFDNGMNNDERGNLILNILIWHNNIQILHMSVNPIQNSLLTSRSIFGSTAFAR